MLVTIKETLFTEETLNEIKGTINLVRKLIYVLAVVVLSGVKTIRDSVQQAYKTCFAANTTEVKANQEDEVEVTSRSNESSESNDLVGKDENGEEIPQVFPADILEWGHCTDEGHFYPIVIHENKLQINWEGKYYPVIVDTDEKGEKSIIMVTNKELKEAYELYHYETAKEWFGCNLVVHS